MIELICSSSLTTLIELYLLVTALRSKNDVKLGIQLIILMLMTSVSLLLWAVISLTAGSDRTHGFPRYSRIFLTYTTMLGFLCDYILAFKYLKYAVDLYKPHWVKWIDIFFKTTALFNYTEMLAVCIIYGLEVHWDPLITLQSVASGQGLPLPDYMHPLFVFTYTVWVFISVTESVALLTSLVLFTHFIKKHKLSQNGINLRIIFIHIGSVVCMACGNFIYGIEFVKLTMPD